MSPSPTVQAYGATNRGLIREANEDNYLRGQSIFAVADGMGGHAAGEVASETALEPLRRIDGQHFGSAEAATRALATAVARANTVVFDKASADPELRGMGTTLTAVMLRDGWLHLAHVGDSRAYLLRDGTLRLLTVDHTLVQQLIDEGRLTPEQAATHPQRSVITRAIGVDPTVQVDTPEAALQLASGDQILLCSDGLTGPVDEATIERILSQEPDGNRACQLLLDAANANGGPDNITVVLLRATPDGTAPPPPPPAPPEAGDEDATQELDEAAVAAAGSPTTSFDPARLRALAGEGTGTAGSEGRTGRGRRALSIAIGVALVLIILGGGGALIVNRAYFVGVDDGTVAIFRGVRQELFGIPLNTIVERTDLDSDDLPGLRRQRLEEGISFATLTEARIYVSETLLPEAARLQPTPTPGATPTATPTPTVTPTPSGPPAPAPIPPPGAPVSSTPAPAGAVGTRP